MLWLNLPAEIAVENTTINPGDGDKEETTTVTYVPNPSSAHVWISNGVKDGKLYQTIEEDTQINSASYFKNDFKAEEGSGSGFKQSGSEGYNYVQNIPFYSYPNKWSNKSAEGVTTLTFQIPWREKGKPDSEQFITYYSITVNPDDCELLRNYLYDMRVKINRLGSRDVTKPINITVEWNYKLPWNQAELPTDIRDIRYLELNANDYQESTLYQCINADNKLAADKGWYFYEMNNVTDIQIPVSTSHKVVIDRVEMIWHDYKDNVYRHLVLKENKNSVANYVETSKYISGQNYLGLDYNDSTNVLNVKRDMLDIKPISDGTMGLSSGDTYTTMFINVYLSHADNPAYSKKIHIEQYPPIYIKSLLTEDGATHFIDGRNEEPHLSDLPINGKNDTGAGKHDYGRVRDIWSTNPIYPDLYLGSIQHYGKDITNINARTYIISISKFKEGSKYIIRDPRTISSTALPYETAPDGDWSSDGFELTNGDLITTQRKIQNYYPTDKNADVNFIAPKIRIASQWGVTDGASGEKNEKGNNYSLTYENAHRRCASYQENGRPAGRWRLPTMAEIKFIVELSRDNYIPTLFGNDEYKDFTYAYYCSSGFVEIKYVNNEPVVTTPPNPTLNPTVRCVYDEWYWGNDTLKKEDKTKFVWGDRPRSTSGNENKMIKR